MRRSKIRSLIVLPLLFSLLFTVGAVVSGDANGVANAATRRCVGLKHKVIKNSDGWTVTHRYTPKFEGGWPADPYTSAVAQFNDLSGSTTNFSQPGRHVDVIAFKGWRVTGLRVTVSTSEPALGG